ncbi:pyruvate dehydrogenase E2 component (dihydrolipoamide acetyltransferase) [Rhizobium sp. RU20A]|uniref:acetoin dehydrogenase dihydrolipoyllysine-residue acetyltransferase subunit n=1 Tax=Rhizobium sp. RU20A TaxID=1907412 RepID=UPI0009565D14|nr:acetoin dehydrogenase dihydrolipoyllysine-residue acetyltransferase subunit [Rhizobium sp. RU20A]SIQ63042.1 pyruvate dehydrogenase E2 component (dihydrolipoamide acetyltransferase) [Rhizobium sp. RU20A]
MARPILMPQVGQDLTEGKVTAIFVKQGDPVKKGDIVAEVESEKAVFEVEAFETGTILEIRYKVGDTAIVLEPLMMVGEEGEVLETAPAEKPAPATFSGEDAQTIVQAAKAPAAEPVAESQPANVTSFPAEAAREAETAFLKTGTTGGSSPLARRLAAAAGVDIATVKGTGPRGAVVKRDVEAFSRSGQSSGSQVLAFSGKTATGAAGSFIKTLQSGTGDPVLLIHGFGGELSAWRPFLAHLGIANPILAIDLPGHGAASATSASDFDALVASVRASLAAEKLDRVHLVGHSLGAAVATAIAGGGDLDIRSLTLIAPAGLGPKINGDYVAGFLGSSTEGALKVWLDQLVHDPAAMPGVLVRATLSGRDGTAMAANQGKLAAGVFSGNTQLFSVREALARFAGPARVIVGTEDRIVPPDQTVPASVALHRLPQVGHLPQLEAAALVGRLVAQTVRSAG